MATGSTNNSVTFNSPNTYTGGTTISVGTLHLGTNGTLGSTNGALNLGTKGALDLGGTTQLVGQIGSAALPSAGSITNGTINVQQNGVFLQSGTFTANLTSTQRSADANTLARLWIGGDPSGTLFLAATIRCNSTIPIQRSLVIPTRCCWDGEIAYNRRRLGQTLKNRPDFCRYG